MAVPGSVEVIGQTGLVSRVPPAWLKVYDHSRYALVLGGILSGLIPELVPMTRALKKLSLVNWTMQRVTTAQFVLQLEVVN